MKKRISPHHYCEIWALALLAPLFTASIAFGEDDPSEYVRKLGYLQAYEKVNMNSAQNGIISVVHVREGSIVKKGDPVIELDHEVLKAQLRVAEESVAKSNAAIDIAFAERARSKSDYERLSILRLASSVEISRAHAEAMLAEGKYRMASAEKKIDILRLAEIQSQINQHILRSPMDGVVVELNRKVAESASIPQKTGENESAILRIAQLNKLRLMINVPADLTKSLKVGSTLPVLILTSSSLDANRESSGTKVNGTIEFISPEADPSSETVRTKVIIDNPDAKYRSGTHAYALIPRPEATYSYSN